jgi:hypothetical protein
MRAFTTIWFSVVLICVCSACSKPQHDNIHHNKHTHMDAAAVVND